MTDAAARHATDTEAGLEEAGLRVSVSGPGGRGDAPGLAAPARRRLVNVLLAKAAVDLMFVCALAAGSQYTALRPPLRGALDDADAHTLRGWVVDTSAPGRHVEVQLYVDGKLAAAGVADQRRADVGAAGTAPDGRHGFVFRLDTQPPGEHEARVYAVHPSGDGRRRTLRQLGDARRFVTER